MNIDFDIGPYESLREQLLPHHLECAIHNRHQMVISTQKGVSIWPNNGNSFWVTRATNNWHIFCWTSIGYSIRDESTLAACCVELIRSQSEAMHSIPEKTLSDFQLTKLTGEESKIILDSMYKAS